MQLIKQTLLAVSEKLLRLNRLAFCAEIVSLWLHRFSPGAKKCMFG